MSCCTLLTRSSDSVSASQVIAASPPSIHHHLSQALAALDSAHRIAAASALHSSHDAPSAPHDKHLAENLQENVRKENLRGGADFDLLFALTRALSRQSQASGH